MNLLTLMFLAMPLHAQTTQPSKPFAEYRDGAVWTDPAVSDDFYKKLLTSWIFGKAKMQVDKDHGGAKPMDTLKERIENYYSNTCYADDSWLKLDARSAEELNNAFNCALFNLKDWQAYFHNAYDTIDLAWNAPLQKAWGSEVSQSMIDQDNAKLAAAAYAQQAQDAQNAPPGDDDR